MLPTRSRLAFRRWRRTRPFWGGLFLVLSGVEFYGSAHMDLLPVHVSLGAQGFLSWLIPLAILLCGLLTWFTPAQRIFYGIVGAAVAVAALIGLNLGGFFVGMLLGIVGGALAAAWTPTPPPPDATSLTPDTASLTPHAASSTPNAAWATPTDAAWTTPEEAAPAEPSPPNPTPFGSPPEGFAAPQEHTMHGGSAAPNEHAEPSGPAAPSEHATPGQQPAPQEHPALGNLPASGKHAAPREQPESEDVETTDVLPTGPLTDQLPTATRSPLGVPPVQGGRLPADGEGPPAGRLLTLLLLLAAVTTTLLALPQPEPAAAAPCPANPAGGSAAKPPAANAQAANPAAPASTSPTAGGNPLTDFVKDVGKLIGITPNDTPTPTPSPSASPAPSPSGPSAPDTPRPKPTPAPTCSPSGSPGQPRTPAGPRHLAVPAGQPTVNQVPSTQISALLSEAGLSFDGVVDLPTRGGTIRALQFSLSSAESTPFELRIPGLNGGPVFSIKSSKLTVSGHVRLYATRIQGLAAGALPQDYTPNSPPQITPPVIFFTQATVQLVFIRADKLTAARLTMGFV